MTQDFIPYWADDVSECPNCGEEKMKYDSILDEYQCPNCNFIVDKDNYYEEVYGFSNPDEMPPGCSACGGPWPACKTSCSMYDY